MLRTLFIIGGTLLNATVPTLLYLVEGPNPRVVVPFIELTALILAAGLVLTWWTWCHESPGTRVMAACYADLRELMDLADNRDPLTGDGVVILTHHDYRAVDGGEVKEFIRVPIEAPRTVVEIDHLHAPRIAELFLLHAHRPVVYRLRAPGALHSLAYQGGTPQDATTSPWSARHHGQGVAQSQGRARRGRRRDDRGAR